MSVQEEKKYSIIFYCSKAFWIPIFKETFCQGKSATLVFAGMAEGIMFLEISFADMMKGNISICLYCPKTEIGGEKCVVKK
ncbi:MAG: hypothetical protein LBQ18_07765 [Campylobacteraceae bacterium]|nr:hypothetical protein [Campylobacteraceae bacterium]